MKYILSSLLTTLTVGMLVISSTYASTPDGQTPANEGVCDGLMGGTPGLYGLCVAFCEAQDHASVSAPITEEELQALKDAVPSGRILNSYNKKKQDGDPDMPCIKVEEPCTCWTSEEFDFVTYDGVGNTYCQNSNGPNWYYSYIQWFSSSAQQFVYAENNMNSPYCYYVVDRPDLGINVIRPLSLTPEQYTACDAQIRQRQVDMSLTCPEVNN